MAMADAAILMAATAMGDMVIRFMATAATAILMAATAAMGDMVIRFTATAAMAILMVATAMGDTAAMAVMAIKSKSCHNLKKVSNENPGDLILRIFFEQV